MKQTGGRGRGYPGPICLARSAQRPRVTVNTECLWGQRGKQSARPWLRRASPAPPACLQPARQLRVTCCPSYRQTKKGLSFHCGSVASSFRTERDMRVTVVFGGASLEGQGLLLMINWTHAPRSPFRPLGLQEDTSTCTHHPLPTGGSVHPEHPGLLGRSPEPGTQGSGLHVPSASAQLRQPGAPECPRLSM